MKKSEEYYNSLLGTTKSRLTVRDYYFAPESGFTRCWLICDCSCGGKRRITLNHFKRQDNMSCGCIRTDRNLTLNLIDGRRKLPEYMVWNSMKQRCLNPNNDSYHHYGGRGITVCDRWIEDFANFINDMGRRPSDDLTIERINNDGNYEPGNCKWATMKEQSLNQRRSKKNKNKQTINQ